jgi:long-chain acyl-CoA synthetase
MYGATEFAGGIAGWTLRDREAYRDTKRGSVGRVHPGVEVRIRVPGTDRLADAGAAGQLDVRARQLASDDPDGWVATTDLASMDDDGFLWILGRTDDAIIRGGFKVSAGKVAEVLKRHPSVRDAAVVGLPDRRLGRVPVAAVEVAGDTELDVGELIAWARGELAPYEVPTNVVTVDALPRTPSLKVSQERLTELLTELRVHDGH